jgi:hypothetical protein
MVNILTVKNMSFVCPCCREPVKVQIEQYDDKEIISLVHENAEPQNIDLSQFNIEFGITEGGEEDGKCETSQQ